MTQRTDRLERLHEREDALWEVVELFVSNRDPHGALDMLIELQVLHGRRNELERAS